MAAARQRARESRPAARRAEPLRALRRRAWLAAALCAALGPALAPGPACAGGAAGARAEPDATALVAFLPARGVDEAASELASVPGLSLAIMSASQGTYTLRQLLLDLGQGARIASSAYAHRLAPQLSVVLSGTGAFVRGWAAARRRAQRLTAGPR